MRFILSTTKCRELEPALPAAPFVSGTHTPDEEVADCHASCVQLTERLQASGHCRQLYGRRATKIVEGGAAMHGVEAGDDLIGADHVVLAVGYRSAELMLLSLCLPLYPPKGHSLTLPISTRHRAPDASITNYDRKIAHTRIGKRLWIATVVDIVGFDLGLEPARLALLRQQARDMFPQGGGFNVAVEWAGMCPATPAGIPLVDSGGYRNLWLNLGHGALDFILTCGSGRLLVRQTDCHPSSVNIIGLLSRGALAG